MDDASRTTRQRIADRLRERTLSASALAGEFDIEVGTALSHVRHVAQSLEGTGDQLLVAPPRCNDCGFEDFDDPANRPSRCPECKSEDVEDPAFTVEAVE
jgi:predicted Zn-ribbon and HTH transcriptional regulator